MKIYITCFSTQNGTTLIEKAFTDRNKAVDYCEEEQRKSNIQQENRDYFYRTLEVED